MTEQKFLEIIEKNKANSNQYSTTFGNKVTMSYSQWYEEEGEKWREFENGAQNSERIVKK